MAHISFNVIYRSLYLSLLGGDLIDHYCNAETVNDVVSGGRQMYVRFYSDSSNVGSGFTLYYREVCKFNSFCCFLFVYYIYQDGFMGALKSIILTFKPSFNLVIISNAPRPM